MRVIAGPEKKTRVMSEKERLVTAYHEMGHAIVGHMLPNTRPGAQDLDHRTRPGARLHDLAPRRGQVPHHPRRARRHDGDDPRRPGGRGDRLRRDHHRRLQRPREGDRDRQADGDALRDVRAARPARLRPRPLACRSSAASSPPSPTTPTRSRARSTTRSAASSRRPTRRAKDILVEHREQLDRISKILLERETIDAKQFEQLLAGRLRGRGLRRRGGRGAASADASRARAHRRSREPAPVPRPRPGFAGVGGDARRLTPSATPTQV